MEKLFSYAVYIKSRFKEFIDLLIAVKQQPTNCSFKITSGNTAGNTTTRRWWILNKHLQISKHPSAASLRSFNPPPYIPTYMFTELHMHMLPFIAGMNYKHIARFQGVECKSNVAIQLLLEMRVL